MDPHSRVIIFASSYKLKGHGLNARCSRNKAIYLPPSKRLEDFERKWKRNLTSIKTKTKSTTSFNLYGLWAYDTVWALAMAVEKAGIVHSSFLKKNDSDSNVDLAALGIFEMGTRLHNTILTTKF